MQMPTPMSTSTLTLALDLLQLDQYECWMCCLQDLVVRQLQAIPGVTLVEPQGAFYCLPVMSRFFGPSAGADGFGPIPDADTLCR